MIRFLPRSIFGLVVAASVVLGLATLVLGVVVYSVSHEALEQQLDQRIETESHALLALLEHAGTAQLAAEIIRREDSRGPSGMGYLLVDAQGRRIAGKLNAPTPQPGWQEFLYSSDGRGGRSTSQALTTALPGGGRLVVAADRTPIDDIDSTILTLFVGAFGTMLVVGVASAWGLGAVVRHRLGQINATAHAIIAGDLERRVPRDGSNNEFDQLAGSLNEMLDRNAELLENLQQVSSDIAHDLRTPLSRLQQALDGALLNDLDVDQYRQALRQASDRAREMLDLFASLLRISEVETFQVREGFRPVNFSELVERCVDAFLPDLEASGHVLAIDVAQVVWVEGDRHLLSQLVVNLIENAARHTPAGSLISISLRARDQGVQLVVADNGPGIPSSDRELVLRRFARLERSRTTPGHGLGLALVAAIARAHFGQLVLSDNGPGLRVNIDFPAPPVLDETQSALTAALPPNA